MGVQDERAPDPERAPEQPGLEDNVVARRRLTGLGIIRRRPVVLGEYERGEIDLLGELDEPVESGPPRLNVVVQGSTSATSSRPRATALSSLACLPDDPRKMRGLLENMHPRYALKSSRIEEAFRPLAV